MSSSWLTSVAASVAERMATHTRIARGMRHGSTRHHYNRSVSSSDHKAAAPARVRVFVLTVSDTRTDDNDTSGRAICELLKAAGHHVAGKAIEKDEPARVAELVRQQAAIADVDAIITTGGTGLTSRDSTFEAIDALLTKRLPGFGELFRMLSYRGHRLGRDDEPRLRRHDRHGGRDFAAGIRGGGAAGDGQARDSRTRASRSTSHEMMKLRLLACWPVSLLACL